MDINKVNAGAKSVDDKHKKYIEEVNAAKANPGTFAEDGFDGARLDTVGGQVALEYQKMRGFYNNPEIIGGPIAPPKNSLAQVEIKRDAAKASALKPRKAGK